MIRDGNEGKREEEKEWEEDEILMSSGGCLIGSTDSGCD
jgi:hypothetical protein